MSGKRVLSIGQCMADHGSVSRVLRTGFGAEVVPAASEDEALALLRKEAFALVLVNRVLDATGEGGIDLIRKIKADRELSGVQLMLVSNYPEAQDEAVSVGAIPGFGKSSLLDQATLDTLRPYVG